MLPEFNHREVLAAASDAIAIGAGMRVDRPHPLASQLTLPHIAYACGAQTRTPRAYDTRSSIMSLGMGTAEFSKVLADGVRAATFATYTAQAEHLAFSAPMEVRDFKPAEFAALDADLSLEPLAQSAEITTGYAFLSDGATGVSLTTYARAILVSREAIINDQVGAIGQIFAGVGSSAARLESSIVANVLEANPVLDDGAVTFDAAHSNILPADLFVEQSLGSAMALLRTQATASGQRADLRAKHLVVEPNLEFSARKMVRDAALDVTVSVLANLPSGRWYLLADPLVCPVVGVLRLFGAKTPVRVEQHRRKVEQDGAAVKVTADLGACLLRRVGIVRGGA